MPGSPSSPLRPLIAAFWLLAGVGYAAPASGQFIDQHFGPLPAVPDSGAYAPVVQAAILEGYRLLALVESPSDDAHLDPAKEAFERALDDEPRSGHAWVGVGIYELTKDEQWLVVLESLKKLFNRDHISMAVKAFERAVAADDGLHVARYNLALAHRQARGEENYRRAAAELERLLQAAPRFPDARLLLALTYRDAGDLKAMERTLAISPEDQNASSDADAFSPAARELLLAYSQINSDQAESGAAAYWRGVERITTRRDADLFWHDIRPIASPEVDAAFHAVPDTARGAFVRTFWQQLADQSFVSTEERVVEHYQRLHYVYAHYRLDLPERRHYSEIVAYVPAWQTGFDDRGVIYLRHGPPDDTAAYSGPEVEQNVSWRYDRLEGDPLVFHFVSDEDVGDFKLVRRLEDALISNSTKMTGQTLFNPQCASGGRCDGYDSRIRTADVEGARALYGSRGELNPVYNRVAMNFDPLALEAEEAELARDITVGTQSQSYEPEPPDAPLPYPVYPVAFREPDGRTSVAFYYALPTSQMSVLRRGGGSAMDYRYQLLITGTAGAPTVRQVDDVELASPNAISQAPGVMVPGVRHVPLAPGQYQFGLKLTDLNSGRFGILQGNVMVDDFAGGGLALSGLVLADRIEPASGTGPFVRWGRFKVLPLPSRLFRRTQPVFVYYEVYGLSAESGGARYRTTYTLESLRRNRNVVARIFSAVGELLTRGEKQGAITYAFDREQAGDTDPLLEYISLDVSDSPAGEYVLTVTLEDLIGGGSTTRAIPLTLVD